MFIAQQKKQENIAEYLLYMWQLEDILRVCELDIDKVKQLLIDPLNVSAEEKQNAVAWYENLIEMMKLEGIRHEGHLQINKNLLVDLTDVHLRLLKNPSASFYIAAYYKTLPYIVELRAKSQQKDLSEIETCFVALYGYLLLKMQRKEISRETQQAVDQITQLLAMLSEKYKSKEEI